jgi:heme exporter protein B
VNAEVMRVGAIVWKDLTAERRTKANFNAVVFLAGLILLLFGFALGPDQAALREVAGGVIWLTVLFSGVLSFNRSYEQELENGALELLLLYPGDRKSIFLGKLLANLTFVLLVEAVLIPAAAILYDIPIWSVILPLTAVLLLGTFGFVTLGTFYSAMASRLRAREVLLPLLLFPMLIPLLIAAVQATSAILAGDTLGDKTGVSRSWVSVLVVFDVIFFVGALFAFEHIIED